MRLNQKGFSLAETLVGISLAGILALVISAFFVFSKKNVVQIENVIEDKVDNIIAERMLLRDLKNTEPSFNNIRLADDANKNFFDFEEDPTETSVDSLERTFTLATGAKTQFLIITKNEKVGTMMYMPSSAYAVGQEPSDPNVAATLTFKSLNYLSAVSKFSQDSTGKDAGKWWSAGSVIMLDTPAMVRRMTSTGPDYTKPARSPIFVGRITSAGESRLSRINLGSLFDYSNPMYPNETFSSEDDFLRNIPPLGGAAPLVRLKPINIIMYYLGADAKTKELNLYRSVFDGTKFASGQLIAAGVQKVIFSRKNPHDSLIYFNIVRTGDTK